ncbi:hypothetical protein GPECTOR_260g659 [Gonium pectorale]|uniref:Helitron helicase-like domain-containing protein n=1 Tax=Gonium pectorale TaxID=33097 RepID=A0A150FW74_GONPE|nr:hypothetical protein GPECTOR_260g659 [Gonium pectorale]|eukprot:KXZ41856.1 hypothetical protein GPECTOR_260g659 [Gonium pectorale]
MGRMRAETLQRSADLHYAFYPRNDRDAWLFCSTYHVRDELIRTNVAYRDLEALRTSPDYMKRCKKHAFAMIRQFGMPTWFITLTSRDFHWPETLNAIRVAQGQPKFTDAELESMAFAERSNTVRSDPVTATRMYHRRLEAALKYLFLDCPETIGPVTDFYTMQEMNGRGTEHTHGLFWVKDAPQYGVASNEEVCAFVDKYVSCSIHGIDPSLLGCQTHVHSSTCKTRGANVCRFKFPRPPMRRTTILEPFRDDEISDDDFKRLRKKWADVHQYLQSLGKNHRDTRSFDEFLQDLDLDEDEYVRVVHSSLTQVTVLLQRNPCEIRINNYSRLVHPLWRGNMDIQLCLDPYAVAMYITSYVTKCDRGLRTALAAIRQAARHDGGSLREHIRKLGNTLIHHQAISATEAAMLVLGLKHRRTTRRLVFVPTR